MALPTPYERRMAKRREEEERVRQLTPPPPPTPRIEWVKAFHRIDPQYTNRVRRIRFGAQARADFPRLASIWALEEAHERSSND